VLSSSAPPHHDPLFSPEATPPHPVFLHPDKPNLRGIDVIPRPPPSSGPRTPIPIFVITFLLLPTDGSFRSCVHFSLLTPLLLAIVPFSCLLPGLVAVSARPLSNRRTGGAPEHVFPPTRLRCFFPKFVNQLRVPDAFGGCGAAPLCLQATEMARRASRATIFLKWYCGNA